VEGPSPFLEKTCVGDFMSEAMLERIGELGEEVRLMEELGSLELHETPTESCLRQLGDGLQEGEGHLGANDRGRL
jgi:hypothetical protein